MLGGNYMVRDSQELNESHVLWLEVTYWAKSSWPGSPSVSSSQTPHPHRPSTRWSHTLARHRCSLMSQRPQAGCPSWNTKQSGEQWERRCGTPSGMMPRKVSSRVGVYSRMMPLSTHTHPPWVHWILASDVTPALLGNARCHRLPSRWCPGAAASSLAPSLGVWSRLMWGYWPSAAPALRNLVLVTVPGQMRPAQLLSKQKPCLSAEHGRGVLATLLCIFGSHVLQVLCSHPSSPAWACWGIAM